MNNLKKTQLFFHRLDISKFITSKNRTRMSKLIITQSNKIQMITHNHHPNLKNHSQMKNFRKRDFKLMKDLKIEKMHYKN